MRRIHVAASAFAALFVCGSLLTVLSQPPGDGSLSDSFDTAYAQQGSPFEKANRLEQWMTSNNWADLPFDRRVKLMSGLGHRSEPGEILSARWTGSITPSATGDYTLVVHQNEFFRGTCRLWIGDALVVDASDIKEVCSGSAQLSSSPVSLTAGQSVSFKMEYAGEPLVWRTGPGAGDVAELITTLLWQSGETSPALLPASILSPPDGFGGGAMTGVKVEFFSDQAFEQLEFARLAGNVELASRVVSTNDQFDSHLAVCKNCYDTLTTNEFEAEVSADPVNNYWKNPDVGASLEFTGMDARKAYAEWLISHPSVLTADPGLLANVFARVASVPGDSRVSLLRAWAAERPLKPVEIGFYPDEYFEANASYEWLGRWLIGQNQQDLKTLAENDLKKADGTCRIELARVLAYGAVEGGLAGWLRQELIDQMDGVAASGDARSSWLVALACFDEVASGFPVRPNLTIANLQEAMLLAETDAMRFQVLGQYAPRLASIGKFSEATALLDQYADRFDGPDEAAMILDWRTKTQELQSSWSDLIVEREAAIAQSRKDEKIAMLEERLQRSEANGRTALAAKYRSMIADETGE